MTANAEARALLDQLMGVERDAPLPSGMLYKMLCAFYCLLLSSHTPQLIALSIKLLGAALPSYGKRPLDKAGGGMVLPGTKRTKSCYDRDVDPLYCAWGVDVYELFVNTKSDIGPNPYKADDSARSEYLGLPEDEKQKLGFEHRLFLKLQELVQHCDRTVHRNHEKLKRELQKQSQKRGGNDYVIDVSEEKVEELVRAEIQLEDMNHDVQEALKTLAEVQSKEEQVLEEQRKDLKKKEEEKEKKKQQSSDSADVKKEENKDNDKDDSGDAAATGIVIDRTGEPDSKDEANTSAANAVIEELGKLTLQKQELLCKIATIITQIGPLEESIHVMTLKLNFVRSDTTTDKTVCEVSGNFMSARDADERIAAHYAGKQYVGWKLVRDKFQQMIQKYGRNGPPRPRGDYGRGGGGDRGGPLQSHQKYMQQGGGGDRYGGGGYNRGRDDRGGRSRYGGGGGGGDGGRWERGGGGYGDRDRGRYDRYDDRRRGGGGGYGDRGGGGGYDRRGGYGRR